MGQLGQENFATYGANPEDMSTLDRVFFAPSLEALASPADLASGRTHSCALFLPRSLVCWGSNSVGELGAEMAGAEFGGSAGDMALLAPISFEKSIAAESIAQIALGLESTCSNIIDLFLFSFFFLSLPHIFLV